MHRWNATGWGGMRGAATQRKSQLKEQCFFHIIKELLKVYFLFSLRHRDVEVFSYEGLKAQPPRY